MKPTCTEPYDDYEKWPYPDEDAGWKGPEDRPIPLPNWSGPGGPQDPGGPLPIFGGGRNG